MAAQKSYTTMGEWAAHYANAGFLIFPVAPDKSPLAPNGFYDGTTDIATITNWWRKWPNALLGCRIPEHVVVLDIDPRHGGDSTWRELEQTYGPITTGRQHMSGRGDGGGQVWFIRPDGALSIKPLNDWARKTGVGHAAGRNGWSAGIDILHHTQRYTILPPSLHPDSQQPYTWASKTEPVAMPGWLANLILKPTATPVAPRQALRLADDDSIADWYSSTTTWNDILGPAGWECVQGDGDGDGSKWRHPNASAATSCSIKHGCLFVYTPNTDFAVTEDGSTTGYTRFRAWATLEFDGDMSAAGRTAREMRDGGTVHHHQAVDNSDDEWADPIPLGDTDDIPEFPVDVLPDWMRDYAIAVADEMQVPVDMSAVLALVATSIINARHYRVEMLPGGWTEPINLYAVIAMPPSAGKSPVVKKMLGAILAYETEMRQRAEERLEHCQQKRRIIEKQMKKAEEKGDINEAQRYLDDLRQHPLPVIPRIVANDSTPEALAQLIHDQGEHMALVSTEGGPFDIMAGRYSERTNLDVYLQSWSGDPFSVDRIGRPSITLKSPLLTIGLTVQPTVIAALADKAEFAGRGLVARFMYSVPPDWVGYRNMIEIRTVDPVLKDRYDLGLRRMLDRPVEDTPTLIPLEPAAYTIFSEWRQQLEYRLSPNGDLRPMSEWVAKMQSSVARVAALIVSAAGGATVDAATMAGAVRIGEYWLAHAKVVHDMWQVDERVSHAKAILQWAGDRQLESFTVRDVYASLRRRLPTAEDCREPLNLLTERGWIRPMFDGPLVIGRRGKDSPSFNIHPSNGAKTVSHARHARHARRDPKNENPPPPVPVTETAVSAHDAHDAQLPDDNELF